MPRTKSKRAILDFKESSFWCRAQSCLRLGHRATPYGRFRSAVSATALTAALHRPQGAPPRRVQRQSVTHVLAQSVTHVLARSPPRPSPPSEGGEGALLCAVYLRTLYTLNAYPLNGERD